MLRDLHDPAGSSVIMVEPATGRFTDTRIEGNIATLRSGTCEPEPFKGFPVRVGEAMQGPVGIICPGSPPRH